MYIPYGRQDINDEDIDAVLDVLRSDFITQGEKVPEFEKSVCSYVGVKYAVAVNSGTSALHIACLALGLTKRDVLWTSPISFLASANCGLYCGADVDFVDVDPLSGNISITALRKKLTEAEKNNRLPKTLVVVHLAGMPCDMEAISQLSKQYGFSIIEDACHALGAIYQNNKVGSCEYSDITVFSFHPVKNITTGEGGMSVTNSEELADKMRRVRSHGVVRDCGDADADPWLYYQVDLGFNYRMTDIQAALGLSQLKRLDQFIEKRQEIFDAYGEKLKRYDIGIPLKYSDRISANHLYIVQFEKQGRKRIFQYLRENGIGVNVHYIPIYKQPYYVERYGECQMSGAESYYARSISLPIYTQLSNEDQDYVVSHIGSALQ